MGARHPRAALIVLDGFGLGPDSPFNAIANAKMPFYRDLLKKYPHSSLMTHGASVGLPDGVMGNSEVGHMTMGCGQVLFQSLARIHRSIRDRSFFELPQLKQFINISNVNPSPRIHALGLLSDAGVHSHQSHLMAFLEAARAANIEKLSVHAILDGRDTPPDSGAQYLAALLESPIWTSRPKGWRLASMAGRYFTMDRDKRTERTKAGADALYGQGAAATGEPRDILRNHYARDPRGDEFFPPTVLDTTGSIQPNDRVFFWNYRADRARQISKLLTENSNPKLGAFLGMTAYDEAHPLPCLFPNEEPKQVLGGLVAAAGGSQFRIAETEKYAHVTFFFNGGKEAVFKHEDRLLIPSPRDCETYDQKPEMSAPEIAAAVVKRAASHDDRFMLMNFANADMVGHTGNYGACVLAMEALDRCLATTIGALHQNDFYVLVTADHGNAEEMQDHEGRPHTQHTLNPVPAIWIEPGSSTAPKASRTRLGDGGLADVLPTLCDAMKISTPPTVEGRSLLSC